MRECACVPLVILSAAALAPAALRAQSPAVAASTRPAAAQTAGELYPGEKLRDPFIKAGATSAPASKAAAPAKEAGTEGGFGGIHAMTLKGIMRDRGGDFAILVESGSGISYILRNGKLYDAKNKPVPGVTGIVKPKQKMVHLMTPDKDVQTLILGEEEGT